MLLYISVSASADRPICFFSYRNNTNQAYSKLMYFDNLKVTWLKMNFLPLQWYLSCITYVTHTPNKLQMNVTFTKSSFCKFRKNDRRLYGECFQCCHMALTRIMFDLIYKNWAFACHLICLVLMRDICDARKISLERWGVLLVTHKLQKLWDWNRDFYISITFYTLYSRLNFHSTWYHKLDMIHMRKKIFLVIFAFSQLASTNFPPIYL